MTFPQENQPTFLLICFSIGYIFGVASFLFDFLKFLSKNKIYQQILIAIRIIVLCVVFVFLKNYYALGEIRLFMPTACLIGFYIYLITLGKIIAKFMQRLYNKMYKGIKQRRKLLNDLRKTAKNNRVGNCFRRFAFIHIGSNNGLSNGDNQRQTRKNRRIKAGNSHFGRAKATNRKRY